MRGALLAAILASAAAPAAAFVRLYPVIGADFMLGQHFFEGNPSSWGGNLDLRVVPAVKFSEQFVLIPAFVVAYQGTKDVTELAGGGQLFQDALKTSLTVKPIWQTGRLRHKPYVGYRKDMLRETKDEKLGDGLFNYNKLSAGAEWEWVLNPRQWASFGVDLYRIRFPNYASLESQAQAGLGRENAGARTLDTNNASASLGWNTDTAIPRTRVSLTAAYLDKDYPEQHIVSPSGQLLSALRKDTAWTYGGALVWGNKLGTIETAVSADLAQTLVRSNQGHYDARLATFLGNYYGYQETSVRPELRLTLPKKGDLSLGYLIAERLYRDRPIQDEEGSFLDRRVRVRSRTLSMRVSIPLGSGFRAVAQSSLTSSDSNQRYEKVFRYNYSLSSHLLGLSYEY